MSYPKVNNTRSNVSMALCNLLVYATSNLYFFNKSPALIASSLPLSVKGTSTQPVNLFSSFHRDSPCLNKHNIGITFTPTIIKIDMAYYSFLLSGFYYHIFYIYLESIIKSKSTIL